MLHAIFQRHHIPPDEIYNKPRKFKRFMYASMILALEEEKKQNDKMKRKSKTGR